MAKTYESFDGDALDDPESVAVNALVAEMVGTARTVLAVGLRNDALAELLQKRGVDVVRADGELDTTPLGELAGERRFDVIVFADVLERVRDAARLLGSARALLAPGGYVVATILNVGHGAVRLALVRGRFEYRGRGNLDHTRVRFFTHESVEKLFQESGYVIAAMQRTTVPVFEPSALLPIVRREDYDAAVLDEVLADPEAETLQFVVRAYAADDGELVPRLRAEIVSLEALVRSVRAELAEARNGERGSALAQANGTYLPVAGSTPNGEALERRSQLDSEHRRVLQISDELRRQLAAKDTVTRTERARLVGELERVAGESERLQAELAALGAERSRLSAELAERDSERARLIAEVEVRGTALERSAHVLAQQQALAVERAGELQRAHGELEATRLQRASLQEQIERERRERAAVAQRLAHVDAECERLAERLERAHALLELREASARDQGRAADQLLGALRRAQRRAETAASLALAARAAGSLARADAAPAQAANGVPPAPLGVTTDVAVHDPEPPRRSLPGRIRGALRRLLSG
ncbi:MAG: methyltransferase domain-containing protein [Candidatus Eremiobacteraeota bacterium]|nr:methyltransferase domain-containing protein [Candidatus Eremiobacteraeota bacterium]